jgi:hypothetical protein
VTAYLLGISLFILAAIATQSILGRLLSKRIPIPSVIFFPILLAGMAVFQAGEIAGNSVLMDAGGLVVITSFVAFLGQFVVLRLARREIAKRNGQVLAVIWFIVFLWIGLGYYSFPILWLPYVSDFWIRTMDVYRIWLYFALPMCLLAALGFVRSATRLWSRKPALTLVLLALMVAPMASGVALKENFALNESVNGVLPYTAANAEIPQSIINYFRNDPSQGRILGIDVPFWIYVLPSYVNKPILDGWYPQSKLVVPLVDINDYRLDDLETASDTGRIETWKALISNSQLLDVTWVMVGVTVGKPAASSLFDTLAQANFVQQAVVPYQSVQLMIFKAKNVPTFVDTNGIEVKAVSQPTPDKIMVKLNPTSGPGTLLIKEAYFPTWSAEADGIPLSVRRDASTGYILLNIPPLTSQVTLNQIPQSNSWNMVSALSLMICIVLAAMGMLNRRGSKR